MNITSYKAAKEKGLVTLKRYGPDYAIEKRQFDPETGNEKLPVTQAFKREEIVQQLDNCKTTMSELEALLTDLDALK